MVRYSSYTMCRGLSRSAKVSAVLHVDEQVKNERDGGSVDSERIVHRPMLRSLGSFLVLPTGRSRVSPGLAKNRQNRRCNLPPELIRLGQLTGQHQRIVAGFVENDNPTG